MSVKLMAVALDLKVGNPLRKLVLLKMCDNANDQGVCWPSFDYLAKHCEISRRSVVNHIEELINAGWVVRQHRTKNGKKTSNVYLINLTGKPLVSSATDAPLKEENSSAADAPLKKFSSAGDSISSAGDALGSSAGDALKPVTMNLSKNHTPISPNPKPQNGDLLAGQCPDKPKPKNHYPDWFESLWNIYPKRSGANDKRKAYQAVNARLREGVSHEQLVNALARYGVWVENSGKAGSEFVMQAATFFGPGGHIENSWRVDHARNQRHSGGSTAERITQQARAILAKL